MYARRDTRGLPKGETWPARESGVWKCTVTDCALSTELVLCPTPREGLSVADRLRGHDVSLGRDCSVPRRLATDVEGEDCAEGVCHKSFPPLAADSRARPDVAGARGRQF